MELFHKLDWKDRLPLVDKFSEKYRFFAATLFYENHPELLPKSIYNEIHREFARRLLSTNDENFETVSKFYKELDDLYWFNWCNLIIDKLNKIDIIKIYFQKYTILNENCINSIIKYI